MLVIFKKLFSVLLSLVTMITGISTGSTSLMKKKAFDITLDEETAAICNIIKENSYLDIENIVTNLPDISDFAKNIDTALNIDTTKFRESMYTLRDKYLNEGDELKALLCYLMGAYFSVMEKCEISLVPSGSEYEFLLTIYYEDGTNEELYSGTYYNPETGLFHGNTDAGMSDIGFNFDINEMVVYATFNCWMRNFGFCLGYDIFSYVTPFYNYHTRRFKFEYAGKEWMIQVWKGRYVIANGAEVGVYNRDMGSSGSYYNCAGDDDCLKMSFELYNKDNLILSRSEESHWWVNGFKLSNDELFMPNQLTLDFKITMKDEEMLKAFCESIDNNDYHDVTYTVDGLTVSLSW